MAVKTLTIDGETKRLSQWAKEAGIACNTLFYRLQRGWEPAKAVRTPTREYPHQMLTVGKESHTVAEWAARLGICAEALRARLRAGYSPEEAVSLPKSTNRNTKRYQVGGITASLPELAARAGIGYATLKARLSAGMPLEEALIPPVKPDRTTKRKPRKRKTYCAYSKETDEIAALDLTVPELARVLGLAESTIKSRLSLQKKGKLEGKYIFIPTADIEGGED